jgi:putative hydrolase of the HAD superfamily
MMDIMGIPVERRSEFDELYHTFDTRICLGEHEDTFLPVIASQFGLNLAPGFSMRRYFLDHFDENAGLWPIIVELKKSLKVGLLTDQYPGMLAQIKQKNLFPSVEWDAVVDSTEVGYRKPMPEIYQIAQDRSGVKAEEILFIDNREKNLTVPKDLGWQTFFYDSRDYGQATKDLIAYLQLLEL